MNKNNNLTPPTINKNSSIVTNESNDLKNINNYPSKLELTSILSLYKPKSMAKLLAEWSIPTVSKEIVVWGTNFELGIGRPISSPKYLSHLYTLTPYQFSVIIGLMLSDGWTNIGKTSRNINARFGLKQSIKHFPFLWKVFLILGNLCGSTPTLTKTIMRGKLFYSLQLQTRAMPCLTIIHNMFYKDGKIVPKDIYEYLNPICLAFWIMGDGSYQSSGSLKLCTDSYTYAEVLLLMNVLIIRYGIECWPIEQNKNQYRIFISKKSMDTLRKIVTPHMEPCFLYKIHL